jgi:KipI family sensor histidine kinase inhibitor
VRGFTVRVRPVGADALLLEVDDPASWFAELWRRREAGELTAVEIVPGARTVLLDGVSPTLVPSLEGWAPTAGAAAVEGRLVEIPIRYGGTDEPFVASLWGEPVAAVLGRIEFRVAFCGFAPGFAYLTGLPPSLAVPRLDTPRPRVPAGSVALAGEYAGIYPTASPGGWRIVGHTDSTMFDVDSEPPALLTPGTRVRFVCSR